MEIILVFAAIGVISTLGLALLAISRELRPYALGVLGFSTFVTMSFYSRSGESIRTIVELFIYFSVMLAVQIAAAPVAAIAFLVQRRKRQNVK